jgi:hypothetical protein
MTNELRIFTDLQTEMREALRAQHPEWIQPNGESPICDSYEARLAELLDFFADSNFGSIQSPYAGNPVERAADFVGSTEDLPIPLHHPKQSEPDSQL